eukprot:9482780-Pyramimonas_sp.AAC.1
MHANTVLKVNFWNSKKIAMQVVVTQNTSKTGGTRVTYSILIVSITQLFKTFCWTAAATSWIKKFHNGRPGTDTAG